MRSGYVIDNCLKWFINLHIHPGHSIIRVLGEIATMAPNPRMDLQHSPIIWTDLFFLQIFNLNGWDIFRNHSVRNFSTSPPLPRWLWHLGFCSRGRTFEWPSDFPSEMFLLQLKMRNKDRSQTPSLLRLIIYGYLKRKRETAPEAASSWQSLMDLLPTSACQALLGPSGRSRPSRGKRRIDWTLKVSFRPLKRRLLR